MPCILCVCCVFPIIPVFLEDKKECRLHLHFLITTLPFFGILPHIAYKHVNIPGNVLFGVCHIHFHIVRKCLRKYDILVLPFRYLNSLTVLMRSKWLHIPYLTECTLPSFLHHLPVCRTRRNGCKQPHISNMLQCNFDKCYNPS